LAMEMREILERIQYSKGTLLPQASEDDAASEVAAQVMRHERGLLLVRVDEEVEFLAPRAKVELGVPKTEALYRIMGTVETLARASDGMPIVTLTVEDFEVIQRRKQERFEVSFPCRFELAKEGAKPGDVLVNALGSGRITDISLGGFALETEAELPIGATIKVEVRLPDGRTDLLGRILKATAGQGEVRQYGVKSDAADTVSLKHLHRLVLRLERERRHKKEASASSLKSRLAASSRRVREYGRRWER